VPAGRHPRVCRVETPHADHGSTDCGLSEIKHEIHSFLIGLDPSRRQLVIRSGPIVSAEVLYFKPLSLVYCTVGLSCSMGMYSTALYGGRRGVLQVVYTGFRAVL
jgi:hypothetical protein